MMQNVTPIRRFRTIDEVGVPYGDFLFEDTIHENLKRVWGNDGHSVVDAQTRKTVFVWCTYNNVWVCAEAINENHGKIKSFDLGNLSNEDLSVLHERVNAERLARQLFSMIPV